MITHSVPPPPTVRVVRRFAFAVLLTLAALGPARALELFPEQDIKPGLKGQVHTVLHGNTQETIDVEVLGLLEDGIAPGVDMVIARLLGDKGNWNGVAAGMSGSPVYVDGKLLGALSYSIGQFSKEPILGITPIRQMLALKDYPGGILPWTSAPSGPGASSSASALGTFSPVPLAVAAPGVSPATLDALDDLFRQLNLSRGVAAVPSNGKGPATASPQPGDPVSALLIWGDMKLGATGTVTWREGDQLLAFGHPFLASGRAEMPIAASEILWTVPSSMSSFKIAKIGEPIGTLRQDRLTAIAGQLGPVPRGLPVSVTVRRAGRPEIRKNYQVARDPFLTPILATMAFRMTVLEGLGNERDEKLRLAARLKLADGREVKFSSGTIPGGTFAGPRDQQLGTEIARRLVDLVRAPMPLPSIESVDLTIDSSEPDGAWTIKRAMPDRLVAHAGEPVRVVVDLEDARGGQRRETLSLAIPKDQRPGTYTLLAASARSLAGELGSLDEARRRTARNADDYLAAMADVPADDQLQVTLARPAEGLVAEGQEYPALPGTAHLLMRSRPGGVELYRARLQALTSASREMDRTILDVVRVPLDILPPESTR